MPIGYMVTVGLFAWCTAFALSPPQPRKSSPSNLSFWFGFLLNELPFVALFSLLGSTALAIGQGDIDGPWGRAAVGLAVLTTVGLAVVARRGLQAGPVIDRALREGLGTDWRAAIGPDRAAALRDGVPAARILIAPFFVRRLDVERIADISYGDAGERNLLDVYRPRSRPPSGPTLVYFHGGAFRSGRKNREARPLLYRLASQGWTCISANYRLSPNAAFPDYLIDVKKVIAWVRARGPGYGANPADVFAAGSSAGGHLASLAGLTPNDPAFQPGFEHADTSVSGVISLYGYYGTVDAHQEIPSSPLAYIGTDAPPFFVAHGDQDTIVFAKDARRFVEQLRGASSNPVVYAELPGAQHSFDLFHSLRFDAVVNAVEAFTAWVRSRQQYC